MSDVLEVSVVDGEEFVVSVLEEGYDVEVIDGELFIVEVFEQGLPGDPGAPGSPGGSFLFDQPAPATPWVIVHNLGYHPNVTLVDSVGREFEAEKVYNSLNQVTAYPSTPVSGQAYLS